MIVDAIIPALDEEASLGDVLAAIPRRGPLAVRSVVVVDNGSTDGTAEVAAAAGAIVVREPRRGYGAACLAGIAHLHKCTPSPDAVVFLDADGADDPREIAAVLRPLADGTADLVIGSRTLGRRAEPGGGAPVREAGALTPQQAFGNRLAVALIALLHGHRYTDLGPFRAIRLPSLLALDMVDTTYGWTVEMQLKALAAGLRVVEVPVSHRRRFAGESKISRTLRGTVGAGWKILSTIARHARRRPQP